MTLAKQTLSGKTIRRSLKVWDQIKALGTHPLSGLDVVQAHRQTVGYSDTPTGRGLALREVLWQAIKALKPEESQPEPEEKRWRPYVILSEQYLNGRKPDWVAAQLYISRRTYYHEQRQALETIADTLRKWEEQRAIRAALPIRRGRPDPPPPQTPFLAPPLPAHDLVGRDQTLKQIKGQLLSNSNYSLVALTGLPGVGKTALALALAHDPAVLSHFCDGVLWAGLGCQPDLSGLLGSWARALGISPEEIAKQGQAAKLAATIHAAIGLRRMLLIIDDAWQIQEALGFKVGGPNCAHLLTTRLSSVALDFAGQEFIEVHELSTAQGLNLLSSLAARAVQVEPDEAEKLVDLVGGLPLALTLMGRHLRKQSHCAQPRRLRRALADLQATETRLKLEQPQSPLERHPNLPAETPLSLQAAIGISEQTLPPRDRRALQSLALLPPKPNSFSENAALAVADVDPDVLDTLVDHALLEILEPGRYSLHQTIADYARLQASPPQARARMVRYFVQYTQEHTDEHALIERELVHILNALNTAFEHDMTPELVQGSIALHPFLLTRGLYDVDERHLQRAYGVAKAKDDTVNLAKLSHYLGIIATDRGQAAEAEAHLERSLALARQAHLHQLEADGLRSLGNLCADRGNYTKAQSAYQRALQLCRQIGDPKGESAALNNLGLLLADQGNLDEAGSRYEQALSIFRQIDDPQGEGLVLNNLGNLVTGQGDHASAKAYYEQALQSSRRAGDRSSQGLILANLGFAFLQVGQYAAAQSRLERALGIFRQIGARRYQAWSLCYLSLLWHYQEDQEAAQEYAQSALQIVHALDDPTVQAHTLTCLGHAQQGLERWDQAANFYQQALELWREMDLAHFVASSLADLARVHLARGDLPQAQANVAEILDNLEPHGLQGTLEPFRIYWVCYQTLQASQDPRAQAVLRSAQSLLQDWASKIDDEELRRSFLENVPVHQKILNEPCG